jgi:signal transduction histidine kinase
VVEDLGVDRATIWALENGSDEARLTHSWIRGGVPAPPSVVREREAPRILSQLRQGHVVRIPQAGDPPDDAPIDHESLAWFGSRSTVVVPLTERGSVVGGLSVGTVLKERRWPDEMIPRLRLLADLFANAFARQDAERTAHESATQIQTLAGRLITAQEEERRRIARELHDGVNQKLSALSIALSTLGHRPAARAANLTGELARLQARAGGLVDEIRHLSHELHPGVLQHRPGGRTAGLLPEFEDEHGLSVTFRADEDLGVVPIDRALCLYRVAQEALGNVAKHAKARQVQVILARDKDDVMLTVADDGCGFDLTEARGRGGLGLISLDERARLVDGQVTIRTGPKGGTEVQVLVPIPESPDAAPDGPAR